MPDEPAEHLSNEIEYRLQQAILNNYPNPERVGCIGSDALRQVAARRRPVRDSAWEHVTHCSPCYREFLDFRNQIQAHRRHLVRRNRIILALAVCGLVFLGVWYWATAKSRVSKPQREASFTIDLKPFSPTRSETPSESSAKGMAKLPRAAIVLQLLLPIGSMEGPYEVRLLDSDLRSVISQTAASSTLGTAPRLIVPLDMSSVSPGRYQIALRPPDGIWRTYPTLQIIVE
jgi:hypothetical protein